MFLIKDYKTIKGAVYSSLFVVLSASVLLLLLYLLPVRFAFSGLLEWTDLEIGITFLVAASHRCILTLSSEISYAFA